MTGTTVVRSAWHTLPGLDAAKALHVEHGAGLSSDEAAARLAEIGPNRLDDVVAEPRGRAVARHYRNPVPLVLVVAGLVALALGELPTACVVFALTLLDAALALHLEGRPPAAAAALQRELADTARVRRDGRIGSVPAAAVVPGDIVLVAPGDVVPVDGRLVDSAALAIDESALTGERVPVVKAVAAVDDPNAPLGDRAGMAYAGTRVTGGRGELVATATGTATEIAQIARLLDRPRAADAPLTRTLAAAQRRLLALGGVALATATVLTAARGGDADAVLTVALAVLVAAAPSALPAAVAAVLAHGAERLARAGVTVRRPGSTVTLGATSAIVAGTPAAPASDPPVVPEIVAPDGRYTVCGGAIRHVAGESGRFDPMLPALALAGDPTGGALAALAEAGGVDVAATRAAHPRVAELPFDAPHRLTATFHRTAGAEVIRCFVVGAPEQVLARSTADQSLREHLAAEGARLAGDGLRVLAIATRDLRPEAFARAAEPLALADDLTPLAVVGVGDPPPPRARAAVAQARAAGIEVRLATADAAAPAAAAARALGLDGAAVTARATPAQTVRLVETLAAGGHVVAMAGEGVHDAPALQAADVGIATGAGSPVAPEAAAMTARDLAAIVPAVALARGVRAGLTGAVRFHAAAIAGLLLAFLGASILDVAGGMPLEPLQTLYVVFTVVLLETIALGSGRPAGGARAAAAAAAVCAIATLAATAVAEHDHGIATARTTGLVAFGLAVAVSALALLPGRAVAAAGAASLVALVLVA